MTRKHPPDTRFDLSHFRHFKRLDYGNKRGCLGRRRARLVCVVCGIPAITLTLENAHIHPRDMEMSDPATADRVFYLCKNHHHLYDCHIITTVELIHAENLIVANSGQWFEPVTAPTNGPWPDFDRRLVEELHSRKRTIEQEKPAKALLTRRTLAAKNAL